MPSTNLGRLRVVAILEGISFLVLLFIAMPLKYLAGLPLAVRFVGLAHGLLFLGFVHFLIAVHVEKQWPISRSLAAFVASLLPFGPFVLDRKLAAEEASAAGAAPTDGAGA